MTFPFCFAIFLQGRPELNVKKQEGSLNRSFSPCVISVFRNKNCVFVPISWEDDRFCCPIGNLLLSPSYQHPLRFNLEVLNVVWLPCLRCQVAPCHCNESQKSSSQVAVSPSLCDSVSADACSGVSPDGCLGLWLPCGVKSDTCITVFWVISPWKNTR